MHCYSFMRIDNEEKFPMMPIKRCRCFMTPFLSSIWMLKLFLFPFESIFEKNTGNPHLLIHDYGFTYMIGIHHMPNTVKMTAGAIGQGTGNTDLLIINLELQFHL